jgi:hypothetical protein
MEPATAGSVRDLPVLAQRSRRWAPVVATLVRVLVGTFCRASANPLPSGSVSLASKVKSNVLISSDTELIKVSELTFASPGWEEWKWRLSVMESATACCVLDLSVLAQRSRRWASVGSTRVQIPVVTFFTQGLVIWG